VPRETETDTGSDAVASEIVAQLRALGYVGGDSHAPGPGEAPAGGEEKSPPPAEEETTVTYHRNLATYLLSRREYARAIAELDEANRREKLPKTFGMLAQSYDALGRKAEALTALEAGWKDVPDGMDPDSILWYVSLALEQGEPARGRRFLDQHHRSLENAPAVGTAAEGLLAEAAGREAEAIRLYETALAADPTLVAAARPLAAAYSRAGKLEALRPVLEAGLARSERIDEYHNLLGALESQAGRKEQALDQFRRARELNPAEPRFALNLSLTLMDLERWGEAAGILESAVAATPDADLYLALGNAYLTLRRPSDALAAFRTAGERGKDSRRADLGVTLSLRGLDRRSEALDFARQSLTRNPDNPPLQQLARDLAAGR
jgi:tetratricopeptide (TPR) repeat protein